VRGAADRLAAVLPQWSVQKIDRQPSVEAFGQKGYRIVLRHSWKEPGPGSFGQQAAVPRGEDDPTLVSRHTDWHFVIFPESDEALPAEAKREVLWHVPDEKQFRLPVAMGQGHGFEWFSYTSIPMQHYLRGKLKLEGGDDRLQLALLGLSVEDSGANTRNSMMPVFVQFQDAGFAALDQAVQASDDPTYAIRSMAYFRNARASSRLLELYRSPNEQFHRAAAYALVQRPFRPDAKEAYLDMILRQSHAFEAIDACLEFGWDDAAPLIQDVIGRPSSLGVWRHAYQAARNLEGKPIDQSLLAAADVIRRQSGSDPPSDEELATARETIIKAAQAEDAAFVALSLATFVTKGNTAPVNKDGIAILRALPRTVVEEMLHGLLEGLPESERSQIAAILRQAS
jgi:hypothetical protein